MKSRSTAIAKGENTKEVAFALDISHKAVKPIAVRSCANPNSVHSILHLSKKHTFSIIKFEMLLSWLCVTDF
jgi:hypothetical protein